VVALFRFAEGSPSAMLQIKPFHLWSTEALRKISGHNYFVYSKNP